MPKTRVRPAVRRRLSVPIGAAMAAVLFLLVVPGVGGIGSTSHSPARVSTALPSAAAAVLTRCAGASIPGSYNGTLQVEGTQPIGPSVANVTVEIAYYYEWNYTPRGGSSSFTCLFSNPTTQTNQTGRFSITAPVPATSCSPTACSTYTGPFGPVDFRLPGGPPPGYFVRSSRAGSVVSLDLVEGLADVTLAPSGQLTVSPLAPAWVNATPVAGDGSVSTATVTYAWRISGTGWTVLATAPAGRAEIRADLGSGPGRLAVWANGSFNGTPAAAGPSYLDLMAVATSVTGSGARPTSVDVGQPMAFTATGIGAGGYRYTLFVDPGLGLPAVNASCTSVPASGGTVDLSCALGFTYPIAGTATPTGNLTNGFTGAITAFPILTVAPALAIAIGPNPVRAYALTPTPITVGAAPGTGSAPFGPACLWPGDGRLFCLTTPGGPWRFLITYGAPGTYGARATVGDATGANATGDVAVVVSLRPTLDPIAATNVTPFEGSSIVLSTTLHGGAGPISFWWNDSAPTPNATVFAGSLVASGPLNLSYAPTSTGPHQVTLTVIDALGTIVAQSIRIDVRPGGAREIAPAGTVGTTSFPAGSGFPISWTALGAFNDRLPAFATPITFARTSADAFAPAIWVNASGRSFLLNATAPSATLGVGYWTNGFLNLTIATTRAGPLVIAVACGVPVAMASAGLLTLTVTPDYLDLVLTNPFVAHRSSTSNATLWQISDRFGNPVPSGYVVVRTEFDVERNVNSPIEYSSGTSRVWVNVSWSEGRGGLVSVLSEWGRLLLPPWGVGGAGPIVSLDPYTFAVLGAIAIVVVAVVAAWFRRRPAVAGPAPPPSGEASDADLQALAEGRAYVLARLDSGPLSLDELALGPGTRLGRREVLAEWTASLVADGSIVAEPDAAGGARFRRVPDAVMAPPSVTVDRELLEEALARRESEEEAGRE